MSKGNILVIVGCLVAGYAIVSVLMKTNADDLRPPSRPGDPPPPAPPARPAPTGGTTRALPRASRSGNWSLLLDIPRSAGPRDVEAAFRRQLGKAEASGDQAMVQQLRQAREAALAEVKNRA